MQQCVQFYYLWKKVCGDESRRLRTIRRRREQDELYNLRSKNAATAPGGLGQDPAAPGGGAQALGATEEEDEFSEAGGGGSGAPSPAPPPVASQNAAPEGVGADSETSNIPAVFICSFPDCGAVSTVRFASFPVLLRDG